MDRDDLRYWNFSLLGFYWGKKSAKGAAKAAAEFFALWATCLFDEMERVGTSRFSGTYDPRTDKFTYFAP